MTPALFYDYTHQHKTELCSVHGATMNEEKFPETGSNENASLLLRRQWAYWATMRLRFIHPELTLTLYENDWVFTIHVENYTDGNFLELAEYFERNVRPMTCNIKLSQEVPQIGAQVLEAKDYESELWLNGKPLPAPEFNTLLFLAEPDLPDGGLDFDNANNAWVFRSYTQLTTDEKIRVRNAATKVGIVGKFNFVTVSLPADDTPLPVVIPKMPGDISLVTSRKLKDGSSTLRDLVHQDEDEWREFLSRRARQEIVPIDPTANSNFACLYDAQHCGASRLSELLTIYDRVDIMPERLGLEWITKHQVSIPDLQELVRLKRVRIILPYSLADYPSTLIEAIAEVDRSSIVLSRALAAKTIAQGQMKEPLLYAPLTATQRAEILSALFHAIPDKGHRELLSSYGQMFSGQQTYS